MRTAPADPLAAAFTEHHAFVRERLRGLGVPAAELDDATQDVFVILTRRLADLDPDRPVRAWLGRQDRVLGRQRRHLSAPDRADRDDARAPLTRPFPC